MLSSLFLHSPVGRAHLVASRALASALSPAWRREELDYLAFLPAARGMFVHCKTDSTMEKGVKVSALILPPKTIALQHIGCTDQLPQYSQTADRLAALRTKWMIPRKYNQSF